MRLFPSLIDCKLFQIEKTISELDSLVDGYHLDIMDGHFVPNLTWGAPFVNQIQEKTAHILWVHIMAEHTLAIINNLKLNPGSIISFHPQTHFDTQTCIDAIKAKGYSASIALSPDVALQSIQQHLSAIDQLLVMSVKPGFSGQTFLQSSLQTIKEVDAYKKAHGLSYLIGCDGGINNQTIASLVHAGVNDYAVAHAIFGAQNQKEATKTLRDIIKSNNT